MSESPLDVDGAMPGKSLAGLARMFREIVSIRRVFAEEVDSVSVKGAGEWRGEEGGDHGGVCWRGGMGEYGTT